MKRSFNPSVQGLESRALLAGAKALHAVAMRSGFPSVDQFVFELSPLNGSGVTGWGTMVQVTYPGWHVVGAIRLRVNGLEPRVQHAASINGKVYLLAPATCPPPSAATDDPSPAGLGPSVISASEADHYTGGTTFALRDISATRRPGRPIVLRYHGEDDFRRGLAQVITISGMALDGTYQLTVPIACGQFRYHG